MVTIKAYDASNETSDLLLSIGSGIVVIQENKVLLVKESDEDFWKFPGGAVVDNESLIEAAKREALEEIGVEIEIKGAPYVYIVDFKKEGKILQVVLFHYLSSLKSQNIKIGDDVIEYKWFDLNNFDEKIAPNIKPAVNYFKS